MRSNQELRNDVLNADLIGVDGMGIILAARLFGIKIPERVTGVDLMYNVLDTCAREGYRPYFLGARPEVLQQALGNARKHFPGLEIAGFQHGYYSRGDEPCIVEAIRKSDADCLFIAMPTPAKERFLATYMSQIDTPFIMGVGGSVDVMAGFVKRAPDWMQRNGLEWFFRVLQEPRRMWKRYLTTNAAFAVIVARAMVGQQRAI